MKDVFINIGTLLHVVQCILIWLLIIREKKQSCMLKRRVGVQTRRSLNISRTPLPLPRAKIPWSMHVFYVENNVFESNLTNNIRVSTLVLRVMLHFIAFQDFNCYLLTGLQSRGWCIRCHAHIYHLQNQFNSTYFMKISDSHLRVISFHLYMFSAKWIYFR